MAIRRFGERISGATKLSGLRLGERISGFGIHATVHINLAYQV